MRKQLIAGNWKMNKTSKEGIILAKSIKEMENEFANINIVIAPPFTALEAVSSEISGSKIKLAAQNFFWETAGAYTGEISAEMLTETGCSFVIIGHSERRQYFSETDKTVNKKLSTALKNKLIPIMCVGETLEHRESGKTKDIIKQQILAGLDGITIDNGKCMVIAYEPIWAIGTGKTATAEQANDVHAYIRTLLQDLWGKNIAEEINILYGGSVKPSNSAELLSQEEIDGALVGGASLDPEAFISIIKSASMI